MSQPSPYYFVAPSDPDGDRFAYSKTGYGHPAPVFVQAAWEWLLERAVRRLVLLKLVGQENVSLKISERAGMFHVPRLLCMPYSGWVSGMPGPETSFLSEHERSYLPALDSADYYDLERTAFGPPAVPALVAEILKLGGADGDPRAYPDLWFCDPSAWPSEKSVDALYRETSSVSEPEHETSVEPSYESTTKVVHRPYRVGGILPVFRPLGDMRVDESDERSVPVWDPEAGEFAERRMVCPRTRFPRSFDADPGHGELADVEVGHDWYVPDGQRERVRVLVLHGLTGLSREFAVGCRVNADLGDYEGTSGFLFTRRDYSDDEHACRRDSMRGYVGWLASAPSPDRTGVAFASAESSFRGKVHPAPDWDARASCWEAWGIPDLGAVPDGSVYRRQLEAACSARPCIPPSALPLPAADESDGAQYSKVYPVASPDLDDRLLRPPCAASPVNAALVLDRLLVTVHPVDRLYARLEAERKLSQYESGDVLYEGTSYERPERGTWRRTHEWVETETGSFVGSFQRLFEKGAGYYPLSAGDPDGLNSYTHLDDHDSTDSSQSTTYRSHNSEETRGSESTSVSASASGLVALRSGAGEDGRVVRQRTRTEYEASGNYYGDDPVRYDDADERSYGEDSRYVPGDSDLLFHPDVMAWMEKAELFAVIRVTAQADGGTTSSSTRTYASARGNGGDDPGTSTTKFESTQRGNRTSRGRYRVVSLGAMNLGTGEFPNLDLVNLVMDTLPHGGGSGFAHPDEGASADIPSRWTYNSEDRREDSVTSGGQTTVDRSSVEYPERCSTYVELCRAYVVVKWKFDAETPPAPSGGGGGAARRGTAARAVLAAAQSAYRRASSGLYGVRQRLDALSARLTSLGNVLSGGLPARQAAVDAARAALDSAEAARDAAAEAVSDAADAVSEAEAAVPSGDADPAEVDAAVAAVDAAKRALREARADLADAEAEVRRRAAELADMEAGASVDQAAAEAALSDAEDAADEAGTLADEAEALKEAASAAIDAAEDAVAAMWNASDPQSAAADAESAANDALDAAEDFEEAAGEAADAVSGAETACSRAFYAAWGV